MITLLKSIVDGITSLFSFVIHSVQTFLNVLSKIPSFLTYLLSLANSLIPDVFKPFLIVSLVVGIVYLIIGRNS